MITAATPACVEAQLVDPPIEAFPEWVLGPEPIVVIGDDNEDERYLLGELSHAFFLHDGRIVIGDRTDMSIRIYSRDGEFEAQVGRKGEGPGEFQQHLAMGRTHDGGFWVFDSGLGRVTIYDIAGAVVETRLANVNSIHIENPRLAGFPYATGLLRSGEFIFHTMNNFREQETATHLAVVRDTVAVWSVAPSSDKPELLATYAGYEALVFDLDCSSGGTGIPNSTRTIPFVQNGILFVASTEWPGVIPVLGSTTLPQGIQLRYDPVRTSDERIEIWSRRRELDRSNPSCGTYESPYYEHFPAFIELYETADRNLWLWMQTGSSDNEISFFGFTLDGEPVARIKRSPGEVLPTGRETLPSPKDIFDGQILFLRRGSFNEPRIEVWPLVEAFR